MATARKARKAAPKAPVYTYRNGKKLALSKRIDRFVVRALAPELAPLAARSEERVSSASTRVKVKPAELEAKMALARKLAPTHHAYEVADSGAEFLVTDRVLVRFEPDTPVSEIDAVVARYALVVREQYSPVEFLFQLTDHTAMNPVKLVVELTEKVPSVELAENDLNQRMQRRQLAVPTDTHYLRSWHLHQRFSHPQFDPRSSVRCEQAWQLLDGFGSPDVVIAISDDGCRLDHGDFNSNGKFAAWGYMRGTRLVKSVDPDALPARMYQSGANHGTSCAGVAAGEADGVLTVGAAPGCRLLPVKWESDESSLFTSDSKLRAILEWIADKADVMSNSWGMVPDNRFASIVTDRIAELAASGGRRGRGIVFLWAAGNENCPIEHQGTQDIPYTSGWEQDTAGTVNWVGVRTSRRFRNSLVALPGVLHIAALSSTGRRSHYSNYGTGIDLAAPSSNSHAFWRMTVPGLGVVAPTGEGQRFTLAFGGTSSATPLVAGIAALVISANPLLTAMEVASILRRTASKDLDMTAYPRTPPAAFDATPAWDVSPVAPFATGDFADVQSPDGTWSPWFGHGKVDAERAVAAALAAAAPPVPVSEPEWAASSANAVDIPDADTGGIEDKLTLAATGRVGRIDVSLDIEHGYIGDLRVTLVTPQGATAVMHDRNGGNQQDLVRTWSSVDNPGLAALRGSPVNGDWRLRVQDLAPADTGRLRGWSLAVTPRSSAQLELGEAPGVTIRDNDPQGVTRTLVSDALGRVGDVTVDVDITHTYIGDLRVRLAAPSGRTAVLHDRAGADTDNLIRGWNSVNSPQLATLLGEPAGGEWTLVVSDHEARDQGKLNRWSVSLSVLP